MRIDLFLKKVGIIESRSKVKDLVVKVNGQEKKPSYKVKIGDEVEVILEDGNYLKFQIIAIPVQNVPKSKRQLYYKTIEKGKATNLLERETSFLKWLFENH